MSQLVIKNFKKFDRIELPLGEELVIITGKSGSGKTQILWAYLLFFRSYNFHLQGGKSLDLREEVCLLLNPAFSGFRFWDTFVRSIPKQQHYGIAEFEGKLLEEVSIHFKIKANGCLTLEPASFSIVNKIAYAHMGTNYQFTTDRTINPTISSFDQSLRYKFTQLDDDHKQDINDILKGLFEGLLRVHEVVHSKFENPSAIMCEELGENDEIDEEKYNIVKLEVMVKSAAFQKIFAALILFFTLVEVRFDGKDPRDRYYLIDEPDALLDKELAFKFFEQLLILAGRCRVKLIVVTANPRLSSLHITKELKAKKYSLGKSIVAVNNDF